MSGTVPSPATAGRVPERSGFARILNNLAHLLGGKAGAGLVSLVYLLIVTHRLGAQGYGLLVLLNGCAVLVGSVVAFSGFHGVVRYGTIALEEDDRAGFAAVVRFTAVVELAFGGLAVFVAAMTNALVLPRFGWPPDAMVPALLYALAVTGTIRATPQGILQVAGRFDLIGLHHLVAPAVRLAGAGIVWAAGGGLTGFVWVWLASAVAEGAAMWALAWPAWRRLADGAPGRGPWWHVPGRAPGFVRFIVSTNVDITVRELAPNLAPLTIGWIAGPAAAGLYALTQRASSVLAQPAQALGQASYAVLAKQAAERAYADLHHAVWRSVGIAALAGVPVVVAFALVGSEILRLLGGTSFGGGAMLLVLVGAARLAALAAAPLAAGLTALGHPARSMGIALVTGFGLYPLLPPLLWTLGADGAGWHALGQGLVGLGAVALAFVAALRAAR